jgi:hypothetical protein
VELISLIGGVLLFGFMAAAAATAAVLPPVLLWQAIGALLYRFTKNEDLKAVKVFLFIVVCGVLAFAVGTTHLQIFDTGNPSINLYGMWAFWAFWEFALLAAVCAVFGILFQIFNGLEFLIDGLLTALRGKRAD